METITKLTNLKLLSRLSPSHHRHAPLCKLSPTFFDWYLRWRHSKGYGVHSPFAYRFITDVLKPGDYGYYAYHQLEYLNRNLKSGRYSFLREAKFLIRLAIFLNTKRIISYNTKNPEAQIVAKALKKIYFCCESISNITFKDGDLLLISPGSNEPEDIIEKSIEHNVPVFAINPSAEVRELLYKPADHGVLFAGKSRMLKIPRPQMEYVAYIINF